MNEDENEVTYEEDVLNDLANLEEEDEIESPFASNKEDFNDDYGTIADDEVHEEFNRAQEILIVWLLSRNYRHEITLEMMRELPLQLDVGVAVLVT